MEAAQVVPDLGVAALHAVGLAFVGQRFMLALVVQQRSTAVN